MMRSQFKFWLWLLSLVCGGLLLMPSAWADIPTPTAAPSPALFKTHCAGCHIGGGNIIRRRKTLKQKALQRNGVDSVEAISQLITHGKGAMSAYGDRLTTAEIDQLAQYVWHQAQNNWP